MAWAYLYQDNAAAAQQALQKVAAVEKSPSAVYARALLGRLSYTRGAYDEAISWWSSVDPRQAERMAVRRTVAADGVAVGTDGL